jgi:hypothetical protein
MGGVLWPFNQHKGRWGFKWLRANAPAEFPQRARSSFTIVDSPGPEDCRHRLHKILSAHAPGSRPKSGRLRGVWFINFSPAGREIQSTHWAAGYGGNTPYQKSRRAA